MDPHTPYRAFSSPSLSINLDGYGNWYAKMMACQSSNEIFFFYQSSNKILYLFLSANKILYQASNKPIPILNYNNFSFKILTAYIRSRRQESLWQVKPRQPQNRIEQQIKTVKNPTLLIFREYIP